MKDSTKAFKFMAASLIICFAGLLILSGGSPTLDKDNIFSLDNTTGTEDLTGAKSSKQHHGKCLGFFHNCLLDVDCHKPLSCKLDISNCTYLCMPSLETKKPELLESTRVHTRYTTEPSIEFETESVNKLESGLREEDLFKAKVVLVISVLIIIGAICSMFEWGWNNEEPFDSVQFEDEKKEKIDVEERHLLTIIPYTSIHSAMV